MKKLNILPICLIALATFAQGCNSNQKPAGNGSTIMDTTSHMKAGTNNNMKNGTPVNQFLEQAAIGGMVEVRMGTIGQRKASLKSIKDFAALIEKDHTKANAQLSTLASTKGLKLPQDLPEMKEEHLNDLSQTSGKDFDSYFINMMVEDHINDIALFEGATKSQDTAVRALAVKILPLLQKHYKQAREISMQFDQNKNKK